MHVWIGLEDLSIVFATFLSMVLASSLLYLRIYTNKSMQKHVSPRCETMAAMLTAESELHNIGCIGTMHYACRFQHHRT